MTGSDRTVTIFGSSQPPPDSSDYKLAEQLGYALAAEGWTICNGGYGGTMVAAAQGAKRAGGRTIGVTCSVFGREKANNYIDQKIVTDNLLARLDKLIDLADAYVVLPGGTGTLVELATVWELQNKKLLPRKPLIVLGDYWLPIIAVTCKDQPDSRDLVQIADTVQQVCAILNA